MVIAILKIIEKISFIAGGVTRHSAEQHSIEGYIYYYTAE
jgi:hypothetical protein